MITFADGVDGLTYIKSLYVSCWDVPAIIVCKKLVISCIFPGAYIFIFDNTFRRSWNKFWFDLNRPAYLSKTSYSFYWTPRVFDLWSIATPKTGYCEHAHIWDSIIVSPVRSTYGGYYGLVVVTLRPQTLHRSHDNLKNPYRIASIFYM